MMYDSDSYLVSIVIFISSFVLHYIAIALCYIIVMFYALEQGLCIYVSNVLFNGFHRLAYLQIFTFVISVSLC